MAICYDRLFHLMIDKKISNAQLKEKAGFSANIITRLKRNEYVSIESIEKICRVMECGVDDICLLYTSGPAAKTSQKQAPQRHADNAMRPHFCFGGKVFLRQHAPAGGHNGQRKTGRARPLPVFCDAPKRPPQAHGPAAAAPRCAMGRAASAPPGAGPAAQKKPAPVSG